MPDLGAGIQKYYSDLASNRMYGRLAIAQMLQGQQKSQEQEDFKRQLAQLNNDLIMRRQAANPRLGIAQQKQKDTQAQDKAWVDLVMGWGPNEVPPEDRARLQNLQAYLSKNPSGALAKDFATHARPKGLQLRAVTTMETDAEGNEYPVTSYVFGDPNTVSLRAAGASGGVTAPTAPMAAPSGTGLSTTAKALAEKYGLGG